MTKKKAQRTKNFKGPIGKINKVKYLNILIKLINHQQYCTGKKKKRENRKSNIRNENSNITTDPPNIKMIIRDNNGRNCKHYVNKFLTLDTKDKLLQRHKL